MKNEREKLISAIKAAHELLKRKAKESFKQFVLYSKPDYSMQWFHAHICVMLDLFAEGKIKKMMILMPPQHGKSELSTRLFPAYLLGKNPDLKIAIASFSDTIAKNFNRAIQRYIDTEVYGELFPDTKLNSSRIFNTHYDNYMRTTEKFEIVGRQGSVKTVGRGGALTSEPVDIGIIDDLYKDREEATSMAISQKTWDWYVDVFSTRLHNDSQQLIMNTRWDEYDICGRLLKEETGQWAVVQFAAVRTKDVIPYDHRQEGEPLWPAKHSLEKIMGLKALNEVTFNSLYQQDPKPNTKLLIFTNWIAIPKWPHFIDKKTWGLDFGKTTGINALIKCAQVGLDAYFHECCYEPGLSAKAIAEILWANGYVAGEPVFCDHMPTKIAALRSCRIAAFPALKGEGSIADGITRLKELTCHYTEASVNLKMETNKYQWVAYGNVITNIPVDEWNHALDASRYGMYTPHNFRK